MIVIFLLLLILVVVFVFGVVTGNGDVVDITVFGVTRHYSVASIFLTGLLSGLVALVLLGLFVVSVRQARRRRLEHAKLEHRRDELEAEKARIDDKLGERLDDPPDVPRSRFDPEP